VERLTRENTLAFSASVSEVQNSFYILTQGLEESVGTDDENVDNDVDDGGGGDNGDSDDGDVFKAESTER
jgi:hypothetical protein